MTLGLALLGLPSARADHCRIVDLLQCDHSTPTPEPSPSPSQPPSSKPKASPSSSSSTGSSSTSRSRGPAPTPALRTAVGYVLDIAGTARNTQHLIDLIAQLSGRPEPSAQELVRGFGHFPVVGYVWYHNDFGAPRYLPYFHLHEGVDLFAVAGTPVIAAVDGVIAKTANGSIGGISFWLAGDDGITYYYGHLQGFAPGLAAGIRVRVGQVLGFVGDTGVAKGTYPHLHFEMHPGGGPAVSPKAVLDTWLAQAETTVSNAYQRIVEYNALNQIGGARWQRVFDLLREPAAPSHRLWRVALDPSGLSLGVDMAFDQIAWGTRPAGIATGHLGESSEVALAGAAWPTATWLTPASGGTSFAATFGAAG